MDKKQLDSIQAPDLGKIEILQQMFFIILQLMMIIPHGLHGVKTINGLCSIFLPQCLLMQLLLLIQPVLQTLMAIQMILSEYKMNFFEMFIFFHKDLCFK